MDQTARIKISVSVLKFCNRGGLEEMNKCRGKNILQDRTTKSKTGITKILYKIF